MEHKLEDPNPKSKTFRLSVCVASRREAVPLRGSKLRVAFRRKVQNLKSKIASQTSMIDGYSLISPQVSIHK